MNGHPFQGNFFDMNHSHLLGNLKTMKWNQDKMKGTKTKTLTLRPLEKEVVKGKDSKAAEGAEL